MHRALFALITLLYTCAAAVAQPAYLDTYFKALGSLKEKRAAEAMDFANQSLANGLAEVDGYLLLGDICLEKGAFDQAEANYLKAEAIRPMVASFGLAKVCALTGRDTAACQWLLGSLGSEYKRPQHVYLRDKALQRIENSSSWKNLWNGDYYSKNEIFEADLEYLISKEEYSDALDMINEKAEKHRLRHQQQAILARIYYLQQAYSSAVESYSVAIKRSSRSADYFLGRANAYLMLQKYAKALDDIQKAIELNPLNPEHYLVKAKANIGLGNAEQSRLDFSLYMSASGENPQTIYEYVQLLQQGGFYMEALRQINKCITAKPDVARYYVARASIYMNTNGYKYAVDDYAMALDLEPPTSDLYLKKGYARAAMGDSQGACIDWKKAASMGNLDAQSMVARYCR